MGGIVVGGDGGERGVHTRIQIAQCPLLQTKATLGRCIIIHLKPISTLKCTVKKDVWLGFKSPI